MCQESDDDLETILTLNCASAGQLVGAYLADNHYFFLRPNRRWTFSATEENGRSACALPVQSPVHPSSTHQNQATFKLVAIVSDLKMFIKPTRDALPVTTLEVVICPFTLALQFDQLSYKEAILMVVPESPGLLLDVLGKWGLGGLLVGHLVRH